jgi:regulator of sigma E protease
MIDLVRPLVTLLLFVVVLGGIVLVHELGHFIAARVAGIRVLEFGIGFPPRARVLGRRGETLWTLNWLPIGGFVKLEGEDGDAADARSFSAKPLWIRLLVLVAGVVMNVVLAAAIFIGIAWLATPAFGVRVPPGGVQADSPAARAGIAPGDEILTLDGQAYDLYSEGILAGIRDHVGETVTLGIRRPDGTSTEVSVTLRSAAQIDDHHGALGIVASPGQPFEAVPLERYASRPLGDAVGIGVRELGRWGGLIVAGLGDLVQSVASNPTAPPPVSGPIGIAAVIGDVFFTAGPIQVLYLAGILSINLAVVNILPFPPLDGGRMLVISLKRFLGRRVSMRAEQLTYVVGFVFLIAFIVWISGFDIARLGGSP